MNDRQGAERVVTPERFVLRPWADPVVEARGFLVASIYTEAVLLPILGPSTVLCLRRLGCLAATQPDGTEIDTRQLARDLGLGDALGRHSQITRTLDRLCSFKMARWSDAGLAVRTAVAPVPEHQLRRLSPELVGLHRYMLNQVAGHGDSVGVTVTAGATPRRGAAWQRHALSRQGAAEPASHAGSMAL